MTPPRGGKPSPTPPVAARKPAPKPTPKPAPTPVARATWPKVTYTEHPREDTRRCKYDPQHAYNYASCSTLCSTGYAARCQQSAYRPLNISLGLVHDGNGELFHDHIQPDGTVFVPGTEQPLTDPVGGTPVRVVSPLIWHEELPL